jgi:hypothetical protein
LDLTNPLKMLDGATAVAKALLTAETQVEKAKLQLELAEILCGLAAAKIALQEADGQLREKDVEITRLTEALAAKASLVEGPGGYFWAAKEGGAKLGYPVCPRCLEVEGRQVTLIQAGSRFAGTCPRCSTKFEPIDFFHKPDASGAQKTDAELQAEQAERRRARDDRLIQGRRHWMD